jgi:hypothetical protein
MFPELPDAKIDIRKPIASPSAPADQKIIRRSVSASRPEHYEVAHSTELPASSHRH